MKFTLNYQILLKFKQSAPDLIICHVLCPKLRVYSTLGFRYYKNFKGCETTVRVY